MVANVLMVGVVKAGGAVVRGSMSVAYGLGGDLERGWDAATVEFERQQALTAAHLDALQAKRAQRLAAVAARAAAAGYTVPGVAVPAAAAPMAPTA